VLKTLSDALALRPDLWHAWSAKLRQLAEMNRIDDALAVAKAAVERFPLLPRLWLDLAATQAVAGDHAGETESLNKALQIAPGWGTAVRQLAEALSREARFDEARKHLDAAISWAPLDPLNHGSLAEVLWKLDQKEPALDALKKAVQLAPAYDWAWSMLRQWGAEIGRPTLAAEAARELTQRRPGEARSWFTLARTLEGKDVLAEQLAALDKATRLEPLNLDYHDYRAFLLTRYGRFDEAKKACNPAAFQLPPTRLRGRAAWVLAQQGKVEDAIADMRTVCAEDARYHWGWTMLSEWYRDANQVEGYLLAARQLTHIAPLDPTSWGCLGDAHERNKDKENAVRAYCRAFDLDPAYTFAGFSAFDLQLSADDLDAAARTLDLLARHQRSGGLVVSREVQLMARRGDEEAAAAALLRLCATPNCESVAVKLAVDAMHDADWGPRAIAILREALPLAQTPATIGPEWVRRSADRKHWREIEAEIESLWKLPQTGGVEARRHVVTAYLEQLGRGKLTRRLRRFVGRHVPRLREDTLIWGIVGAAMLDNFRYRQAIEWMAGWQDREGLQQFMVTNLAQCQHALGNFPEAARLSRVALEANLDKGSPWPHLILALDHADAGRIEQAQEEFARINGNDLDEESNFFYHALWAIVEPERQRIDHPGQRFARSAAILQRLIAEKSDFRKDPGRRRIYRRTARAIARRRGGLMARLWLAARAVESVVKLK
jgi:tetratricopeptide (TPR) repeat protein